MTYASRSWPEAALPQGEATELQRHVNAGRLAASVSHEVMSALGVVQTELGFLCDLMDGPTKPGQAREVADDARSAMSRAVQRVAAVLSLARARPVAVGPVDVKEAVGAALFELEARLSAHTIVREFQPVPQVLADRGALLQTLVSVLLDAADATPPRGRIGVTLRTDGGQVIVSVADDGRAAPAHQDDGRGTPVWISRNVARSFGAELTVSFDPSGRRRVSLRLPSV
ncbi:MAG TPA: ATP-binding protein [Myxococcales bacterium]|jgi:signal transduction histidine kinase